MFINNAFAADAATAVQGNALGGTLVQLALILLVFYFLLIRPQQKKMRAHAAMVEALKGGEKVLLSNGIYGTISKIKDDKAVVKIADGIEITVDKMTVGMIVTDEKETGRSVVAAPKAGKTVKNTKKNK